MSSRITFSYEGGGLATCINFFFNRSRCWYGLIFPEKWASLTCSVAEHFIIKNGREAIWLSAQAMFNGIGMVVICHGSAAERNH